MKVLYVLMLALITMSCGCKNEAVEKPREKLYSCGTIIESVLTGEEGMVVAWYHDPYDRNVFGGAYDVRFKNKTKVKMQEGD